LNISEKELLKIINENKIILLKTNNLKLGDKESNILTKVDRKHQLSIFFND